jgi:hypothetical protein
MAHMESSGRSRRLPADYVTLPFYFIVTWLGLGFSAAMVQLAHETGGYTIWEALKVSAPLTVAIAAMTIFAIRGKLNAWGGIAIFVGSAILSYLFGITATSKHLPEAWHVQSCVPAGLGQHCSTILDIFPPNVAENLASLYWHLYGASGFVASVGVGLFLGWFVGNKIFGLAPANTKPQRSQASTTDAPTAAATQMPPPPTQSMSGIVPCPNCGTSNRTSGTGLRRCGRCNQLFTRTAEGVA